MNLRSPPPQLSLRIILAEAQDKQIKTAFLTRFYSERPKTVFREVSQQALKTDHDRRIEEKKH